jgi:glycosyltransferase involved in cell wall biosynthesis
MTDKKLSICYLVKARMPTEKAYGLQTAKMCEAFSMLGHRVELWSLKRRSQASSHKSLKEFYALSLDIEHVQLPAFDVYHYFPFLLSTAAGRVLDWIDGFIWAARAVRTLKRRRLFDRYITRDPSVAFVLTRAGLPTILEMHSLPQGPSRFLLPPTLRNASLKRGIAITRAIGDGMLRFHIPTEKLRILPSGVDRERFVSAPHRAACRDELGLPQQSQIIGYVGRFNMMGKSKGISSLIAAVAELKRAGTVNCLLLCVGGPLEDIPGLERCARDNGLGPEDFIFHDFVPHDRVPLWIKSCDALAFLPPATQYYEHFVSPLKLFEYMASGVPFVASDLPSLRELVADGVQALLVDPDDAKAVAACFRTLLFEKELGNRLANAALDESRRFAWTDRARTMLDDRNDEAPPAPIAASM